MLKSDDYGKHLLGVQDLIKKHSLVEAEISTLTDRAKSLSEQVHIYTDMLLHKTCVLCAMPFYPCYVLLHMIGSLHCYSIPLTFFRCKNSLTREIQMMA